MAAKKARKSVKKRASKKKRASWGGAVIDRGAALSPYGRDVQQVFSAGVQKAFAKMARLHVPATVVVDGKVVRAVPTRSGGRFVVREPSPSRSRGR